MSSIRDLVEEFVDQLSHALETQTVVRARKAVEAALAGHPIPQGNGRSRAAVVAVTAASMGARKPRKKPPIQLCPVPGCTERAAPIFGMVCAKHKDVAKAKIRKYREARRAGKLSAKGRAAPARKGARKTVKAAAKLRAAARKPATKRKASARKPARVLAPPKVEVMQKPVQVRAGSASAKVKARRPAVSRETAAAPAPQPAPAPAQA
jgi:hypothetical protein